MLTVYVPGRAYVCVAVIGFVWLVVLPVVAGKPSPQATAYAQGPSLTPGSLKVALTVTGVPIVADWLGPAVTAGATFAIVAVVVAGALAAPCVSVTVSVTV